jgi:hypothetical protein
MLRFTIRDVLWLTVVAAMGVGWWIEFSENAPLRRRCDRLESLAAGSVGIMQHVGIKAEFRDDNILIGGYQMRGSSSRSVPLDLLEPATPNRP